MKFYYAVGSAVSLCFCLALLLLSFYWTHQKMRYNIVNAVVCLSQRLLPVVLIQVTHMINGVLAIYTESTQQHAFCVQSENYALNRFW